MIYERCTPRSETEIVWKPGEESHAYGASGGEIVFGRVFVKWVSHKQPRIALVGPVGLASVKF